MDTSFDPTLLDLPDYFETERLLCRIPRHGDGATIHEAIVEAFEELHAWMPWAKTLQTPPETERFARIAASNFVKREDFSFALFRKEDSHYLGMMGVHPRNWEVPSFEIGYWLRTSAVGGGYMTEAVNGAVQFAFQYLKAERLEIRCDSRNEKSASVAKRTGFQLEAHLRRHLRATDGNFRDTLIFAKIRE